MFTSGVLVQTLGSVPRKTNKANNRERKMLAFSSFPPSCLEWENNPVPISSSNPNKFVVVDDNKNNSSSSLNSDYLGPIFSPLIHYTLEGNDVEFEMSKFREEEEGDNNGQQFDEPAGIKLGLEESERAKEKNESSGNQGRHEYSALAKKLSHNARERDRRKRMNASYSALRALLPAPLYQQEELSIPETVSLVVDYIPKLQKEIQNMIQTKQELISKISSIQGHKRKASPQEGKQPRIKTASLCSISVEKLGERETVIHISTYERIRLPEVLLLLENHWLLILNVSWSQCFGGRTFCNIHLWIEDGNNNTVKWENLNEELLAMFEKEAKSSDQPKYLFLNKEEPTSTPINYIRPVSNSMIHESKPHGFFMWENGSKGK